MSKGSISVPVPFKPLEILKQKPTPVTLDQLHEYTGTETEGLSLFKILENQLDQNTSVKRDIVLDRLQSNGFLVQSCQPLIDDSVPIKKKSIASLLGSDDEDDKEDEEDEEENQKEDQKQENVNEEKNVN